MKTKIINSLLGTMLIALVAFNFGCVKEDFDNVPKPIYISKWTKNTTIAQVKSYYASAVENIRTLATAKGVADGDIIIEGTVTSNDSCSNFYKTVTIQDETGGIDIKINDSDIYVLYDLKPGRKVVMRLNDLYLDNYNGVYQIGVVVIDNGSKTLTEINPTILGNYLEKTGTRQQIVPEEITISQIMSGGAPFVQKLVTVTGVQFLDATKGYAVPGVNTNRTLVDANKNMLVLRNSGFSKFKNVIPSSGSGSITGILSIFGSTYQLYIRDLNDVKLDQPRMGGDAPAANTTIAALKALNTGSLTQINTDVVVEGVINSDDEFGNIYKQLFIQDANDAIEVKIDAGGLSPEFPVGTRIRINCNGLYLGTYGGIVQLGGLYNSAIGRMTATDFYKHVSVIESGVPVTPLPTDLSSLTVNMVGKLITLNDVQFAESDLNKTWSDVGVTTNRTLQEKVGGKTVIVRTSAFADFAGTKLPSGDGTITAVLTKYNSDYQLVVRDLRDVKLDKNPRTISMLFKEDFSGATLSSPIAMNGWKTVATAGTKTWVGKEYPAGSGAKYAEVSAFSSGQASNIAWLVSPSINLTTGGTNYLSFDTEYAYWAAGTTLEALVSTNYDGNEANIGTATWSLLNGRIVTTTDGQNKWVSSGKVDLSAYSGKIYVAFRYTGSGTLSKTTTFRVDNVSVYNLKQ